jgi:hypothetical protein
MNVNCSKNKSHRIVLTVRCKISRYYYPEKWKLWNYYNWYLKTAFAEKQMQIFKEQLKAGYEFVSILYLCSLLWAILSAFSLQPPWNPGRTGLVEKHHVTSWSSLLPGNNDFLIVTRPCLSTPEITSIHIYQFLF